MFDPGNLKTLRFLTPYAAKCKKQARCDMELSLIVFYMMARLLIKSVSAPKNSFFLFVFLASVGFLVVISCDVPVHRKSPQAMSPNIRKCHMTLELALSECPLRRQRDVHSHTG